MHTAWPIYYVFYNGTQGSGPLMHFRRRFRSCPSMPPFLSVIYARLIYSPSPSSYSSATSSLSSISITRLYPSPSSLLTPSLLSPPSSSSGGGGM